MMKIASTADTGGQLQLSPPSLTGLSRKSPTVAPSGRVRMNAVQNNATRDAFVQTESAATTASAVRKISAPPPYHMSPVSAIQSPSAVPSV